MYLEISGASRISRRYFALNSFDGALTILGIVSGALATGRTDPVALNTIIVAGLGASLGMGASGFSGAYFTERAERAKEFEGLKRAMLSKMDQSVHKTAFRVSSLWAAFIDGAAPAVTGVGSLVPVILSNMGLLGPTTALLASISVALTMLFLLGSFLGTVSGENLLLSGVRMFLVGLAVAVFLVLVGGTAWLA